jgi:hypothetical protein
MQVCIHIFVDKAILCTILPPLFIQLSTLAPLPPHCAAAYRTLPHLAAQAHRRLEPCKER